MLENASESECRACLFNVPTSGCQNIFLPWNAPWSAFGSTIAFDLARVANIEVTDSESQPHTMCQACCLELYRSCKFIAKVQQSAEALQERSQRENTFISDPQMWPKPIDLEKSINGDMFRGSVEVEIKQEIMSDDDCTADIGRPSMMDVKVESMAPKRIPVVTKAAKVAPKGKAQARKPNGSEKYEHVEYLDQPLKEEPRGEDFDIPLECMLCSKAFQSVSGLKAHVIAQHSYKGVKRKTNAASPSPKRKPDTHVCATCRRAFATPTDLMVHETCHNKSVCYGCNQKFDSFEELRKHRRRCQAAKLPKPKTKTLKDAIRPPPTPWKCSKCNETFSDIYYMNIHNEIHHNSQAKSDHKTVDKPQNTRTLKVKVRSSTKQLENDLLEHLLGHEDNTSSPEKSVKQSKNEKVTIQAEKVEFTKNSGQDIEQNKVEPTDSSKKSNEPKKDEVETGPKQAKQPTEKLQDQIEQSSNENKNVEVDSKLKNLTDEDKVAYDNKTNEENAQTCTELSEQMDVDQTDGKGNSENDANNIKDTEITQIPVEYVLQDVERNNKSGTNNTENTKVAQIPVQNILQDIAVNNEIETNNTEDIEVTQIPVENILQDIAGNNESETNNTEDTEVTQIRVEDVLQDVENNQLGDSKDDYIEQGNTSDEESNETRSNLLEDIIDRLEESNEEVLKKKDDELIEKKNEQLKMVNDTSFEEKQDDQPEMKDLFELIQDTPQKVIQDNQLDMKDSDNSLEDNQDKPTEVEQNVLEDKPTELKQNQSDISFENTHDFATEIQENQLDIALENRHNLLEEQKDQSDNSFESKQDNQIEEENPFESLKIILDVDNVQGQENKIHKETNSESALGYNLDIVQEKEGDFNESEDVQKIELELLPKVLDEDV